MSYRPHHYLGLTIRAVRASGLFHGWTRTDWLTLAGVIAVLLVGAFSPLRKGLAQWLRAILLRAGFPRRRYAAWFVRNWGTYENPYLRDQENLDLSNTYVPLSFQTEGEDRETLSVATAVLDDRGSGNLVIEGAPGPRPTDTSRQRPLERCAVWRRPGDAPSV